MAGSSYRISHQGRTISEHAWRDRAQSQQVRVGAWPTSRVTFVLPLGMLAEVMHIAPEPREAYRQADAIAHIRIVRQLPPLPCSELGVLAALLRFLCAQGAYLRTHFKDYQRSSVLKRFEWLYRSSLDESAAA